MADAAHVSTDFIEDKLSKMTLTEKVSMLGGVDLWHTVSIERLNIPSVKMSDGPNGVRGGGSFVGGVKAACFPAGIALASTWDTDLVKRIGQALGQEAKTKSVRVLLAPTVNIHRSPLNGRNFECYSEDPYLSARMAVAYVTGVQSQGVGTAIKHFVCNDSEFERTSISSEVGERALREIYLPPFEAAVREAKTWMVMAAYNRVNGIAATEHPYLLDEILRKEWGFDGVIVSDWFLAVKSTAASVNAGLDLEMPGPPVWRGESLLRAVERGEVAETTIDECVRRLLRLVERTGAFEYPDEQPEQAVDRPEHRALLRQAAAEGCVLFKNERNVLPLQRDTLNSLAIIGPNAQVAQIMAGGSAQVNAHYAITPFDGIMAQVGTNITVGYEPGCTNHKRLPLLDNKLLFAQGHEEHGFTIEYFNNVDLAGEPIWSEFYPISEWQWFGSLPAPVDAQQFSARATARFLPRENGEYTFGLISAGLSRFLIDGQETIDNWTHQTPGDAFFGAGSAEVYAFVTMQAGHEYTLTLEFSSITGAALNALRLGCLPPFPADALERAVRLAASADMAVIFAGLSGEWESEGFDRPDMDLPDDQNALIASVAAANKNTIVVLNTGSPINMPWLDQVAAVVQIWYPGQECGNAIADVLFGETAPAGKLTQTWPRRLEDNPAYINYPGENGKVHYGEGLFVGYRYYEKKRIAPLFPFGFGLTYTTFEYSELRLSAQEMSPNDTLQVEIDITNTGKRAGKEIVQLYVRDIQSHLQRPEKELKAFAKIHLEPGERKTVTFELTHDVLTYYDDLARAWVVEPGEFAVQVGASSQDIRATGKFDLLPA